MTIYFLNYLFLTLYPQTGIWAGIFSGVCGALGLMNIKPLLNGFLACSLISVATSTLALALTGIGLVRDYNISQQDPVSRMKTNKIFTNQSRTPPPSPS